MVGLKKETGKTLKEWQKEDRHRYSLLKEAMLELDNIEQ